MLARDFLGVPGSFYLVQKSQEFSGYPYSIGPFKLWLFLVAVSLSYFLFIFPKPGLKQESLLSCLLLYVLERADRLPLYLKFFFSKSHGNKIRDEQGDSIKVSESFGDFTELVLN